MGFMDAYKRLEKLCGEIKQADKKPRSAWRVLLWMLLILALISLVAWIAWGNTALQLNTITVSSPRLPQAFDGYRIAQVSDLHNAQMGEGNEKLIGLLRQAQPDMIAITGDIVDSGRTDIGVALDFARQAVEIAPCYYVCGNNEVRLAEYGQLKSSLQALGVTVLENASVQLHRGGQRLQIWGVDAGAPPLICSFRLWPEGLIRPRAVTRDHCHGSAAQLLLLLHPVLVQF